MRHPREAFTTLGVLALLYAIGRAFDPLFRLLPEGSDLLLSSLFAYGLWFALGCVAGVLSMKLLTWRFRVLAMVAVPAAFAIVYPIVGAWQMTKRFYISPGELWPAVWRGQLLLGMPVLGILLAAAVVRVRSRSETSAWPPNTTLERTRDR
jgi:Kef-type K+ transport system membrane component KefB